MDEKEIKVADTESEIILDKIINIDEIKDNSVIIFKIGMPTKALVSAIQNFVSMYGEKLENKQCSLLVLGKDAQLDILDESEMDKAGWQKKNKSNLIIPR